MKKIARLAALSAAALAALAALSLDLRWGDLRYDVGGKTVRHWSLVDASVAWKPACAAGFIRSGGFPCGGATSYTLTGPSSGNINASLTYTLTPSASTTATVTPADASHGGVFSPTNPAFSGASPVTFTYAPLQIGTYNLSTTNSASLTDPPPISFTTNANNSADGYPGLTGGSWQDNATTHTTGNAGDPFGGSNTAIVKEDSTTNFHYLFHHFTLTASQSYVYSAFFKQAAGTRNAELSACESGYSACLGAMIALPNCTLMLDISHGGPVLTFTSRLLSNGWCLAQISGVIGNFTDIIVSTQEINGTTGNYAGDGSSSIKVYGVTTQ